MWRIEQRPEDPVVQAPIASEEIDFEPPELRLLFDLFGLAAALRLHAVKPVLVATLGA